jgi:lipoprotein-anchoring transpeptidase ErfK/SrfK
MRGGSCFLGVIVVLVSAVSCSSPEMWGWKPSPLPTAQEPLSPTVPQETPPEVCASQDGPAQQASLGPQQPPAQEIEEPLQADWIVVLKGQRIMRLLRRGELIREYQIALGKNPTGPKMRQGDNRTPEGLYIISGRNPNSAYHRALKISYPDPIDIINARSMGTKAGGNVMIHGLPNGVSNKYRMERDWTNGCIAVSNEEMEEIWNLVPDGTPIEILP